MRTIDKIITKVNTTYGAPMGRQNKGIRPLDLSKRVYDCAVPMADGAYDKGGAYWGHGAHLRVSYTKDLSYVEFYRIDDGSGKRVWAKFSDEMYELHDTSIPTIHTHIGQSFSNADDMWQFCADNGFLLMSIINTPH